MTDIRNIHKIAMAADSSETAALDDIYWSSDMSKEEYEAHLRTIARIMFESKRWYRSDKGSWQIMSGIFEINDVQVFAVRNSIYGDIITLAVTDTHNPSIAEILGEGCVINAGDVCRWEPQ